MNALPQQIVQLSNRSLKGLCARLAAELDAAHAEPVWNATRSGRIRRLGQELAAAQRALALQSAHDIAGLDCALGLARPTARAAEPSCRAG